MPLLPTLFPGVRGLLRYGRWSFLAIALAFLFVLDLWLLFNFYWTDLLTSSGRYYSLGTVLLAWYFLGQVANYCEKQHENRKNADAKKNFFADAITQYLQGNWFEAECFLNEILKRNPRDAEALLMLATLFRHTNRVAEGKQILLDLKKLDESRKWFFEIENELLLMGENKDAIA